jgi:hypothetical protein
MTSLTKVLSTVNSVLSVIKQAADSPGVNLIPYVSTASSAIGALQAAYAAEQSIEPYVAAIANTFSGRALPSQTELEALDRRIEELEAKVDAPLPPTEAGEKD